MDLTSKIYVAGHEGLVGAALIRHLQSCGYHNLIVRKRHELDLRDQASTVRFFSDYRPDYVFLAAAKVGGIAANVAQPADFLYDNIMIECNVLSALRDVGVKKLCFLGSSCIYPRECPQPMKESALLTGRLEPTNEGYALAKIAGLKLAQFFAQQYQLNSTCLMPCNIYGPNDSFDLARSHVLSALVRRFVDATDSCASEVRLWGTGTARREFMHVDDLASACLHFIDHCDSPDPVNIGWGDDISIADLANIISEKVSYPGTLAWDPSKPDGMPRKCLDVSRMRSFGFTPRISLMDGIDEMIAIYRRMKYA
jgi:GDP-L-fucose synthase